MAFRPINGSGGGEGGSVMKWTTLGQSVQGRVVGYKNGRVFPTLKGPKQSRLLILDVGNGVQTAVPLPSDLSDDKQIEYNAKPGSFVKITLAEFVKTNQPQPYKKFELLVDDGTDGPAPQQPSQQPATSAASASAPASYDNLAALLSAKVGPAAATPMLNALQQLYPDPAVRLENLKQTLRANGVAV